VGSTLLLDQVSWDLVLTATGNMAVATEPYSLAQDAASAIQTYLGECYWDTTLGVPYLTKVFNGLTPSLPQIKQLFVDAAMTVPDVANVTVYLQEAGSRQLTGQVQVTSISSKTVSVATFTVLNPQGVG
jgi:hypothetical protein